MSIKRDKQREWVNTYQMIELLLAQHLLVVDPGSVVKYGNRPAFTHSLFTKQPPSDCDGPSFHGWTFIKQVNISSFVDGEWVHEMMHMYIDTLMYKEMKRHPNLDMLVKLFHRLHKAAVHDSNVDRKWEYHKYYTGWAEDSSTGSRP